MSYDKFDYTVMYGVAGGLLCAGVNWIQKNSPKLESKDIVKYLAFFGVMGCLGSALSASILPDSMSASTIGLIGGFVGSYALLGIAQYM